VGRSAKPIHPRVWCIASIGLSCLLVCGRVQSDDVVGASAEAASGSIYGKIVDGTGTPIKNAEVRIHESEKTTRYYTPAIKTARSDANGMFEISAVDDGVYIVAADYGNLATTRFSTILEDHAHQRFEIALLSATTPSIKFVTKTGEPIAGVKLTDLVFRNVSGRFWLRTSGALNWKNLGMETAASDKNGELQLPPLPEGTRIDTATFEHPDFAPVQVKDIDAVSKIVATATPERGARLKLKIESAPGGEPIADAMLTLRSSDGESLSEMFRQPVAVRDGIVELVVTPGKYFSIQLEHDRKLLTPIYQKQDISDNFELGTDRENEFVFHVREKVHVHGRAVDPTTHAPIKDAWVAALVPNEPATPWLTGAGVRTDAKGEYSLEVPEGSVRLVADFDGRTTDKAYVEVQIAKNSVAALPDVELRPTPTLKGRVVDPDGKPVAGAILRLGGIFKFYRQAPVAADRDGRFELPLNSVPGNGDLEHLAIVWDYPLDVFHPTQPLSTRVEVHLNHPELISEMLIQLRLESVAEFSERADAPTTDVERKLYRIHAEASKGKAAELVGVEAPELDGQLWINAEGGANSLAAYRGKYVLLDFWTVWCGACHLDFPEIKLLREAYKDAGLVVIGVHDNSVDADAVREHVRQQKLDFPIVIDQRDGRIIAAYKKIGTADYYPSYVLIGPDGRILLSDRMALCKLETVRKHLLSKPVSDR
jgi:thiol-disulfide isomerase/thioredoxin